LALKPQALHQAKGLQRKGAGLRRFELPFQGNDGLREFRALRAIHESVIEIEFPESRLNGPDDLTLRGRSEGGVRHAREAEQDADEQSFHREPPCAG